MNLSLSGGGTSSAATGSLWFLCKTLGPVDETV